MVLSESDHPQLCYLQKGAKPWLIPIPTSPRIPDDSGFYGSLIATESALIVSTGDGLLVTYVAVQTPAA